MWNPPVPFEANPEKTLFNPSKGILPPPEVLLLDFEVDPAYPAFVRETFAKELKRNFIYQIVAFVGGLFFGLTLVAASTFLAYTDHPKMAAVLLGVNVLGFAGKLLGKSRRGED